MWGALSAGRYRCDQSEFWLCSCLSEAAWRSVSSDMLTPVKLFLVILCWDAATAILFCTVHFVCKSHMVRLKRHLLSHALGRDKVC